MMKHSYVQRQTYDTVNSELVKPLYFIIIASLLKDDRNKNTSVTGFQTLFSH